MKKNLKKEMKLKLSFTSMEIKVNESNPKSFEAGKEVKVRSANQKHDERIHL
jgi:hypothetical protein